MLKAKLEVLEGDYPPSPRLFVRSGWSFTASQLFGSRPHEQDETSQHLPHLFLSTLFSSSDLQDRVWVAETAEEEEEETFEEEEEVLAVQTSLVHLFPVGILLTTSNSFGTSSGYPSRPK